MELAALSGALSSVRGEHRLAALGHLAGFERPHHFRRTAGIDMPAVDAFARIHGRAGLENHVVADHRAVEDHGPVADDDIAADHAGMHAGILAHGDAVADDAGKNLVRDVQRGARAGMEIVAGLHVVAVGAQHRMVPDRGMAAERDAAEDRGTLAGMGERRRETTEQFLRKAGSEGDETWG